MINTPLFECLERLVRIQTVLDAVDLLVDDLEYDDHSEVRCRLKNAKERERSFLKKNINEWLKDNG